MNFKKALFMALVLVLAALYLWRLEQREPDLSETEPIAGFFSDIKKNELSFFGMKHERGEFIVEHVKDPANNQKRAWVLRNPVGFPTHQESVNSLASSILQLHPEQTLQDSEVNSKLSVYGLEKPALALIVSTADEKRIMHFGKKHPFSEIRYARMQGGTSIHLVSESDFLSILKVREDIWDPKPLMFEVEKTKKVQIIRLEKDKILMTRNNSNHSWVLSTGDQTFSGDNSVISRLLAKLADVEIVDLKLAGNSLVTKSELYSPPKLIVEIELTDKKFTVLFGRLKDTGEKSTASYYFKIKGNPWVYHCSGKFMPNWFQAVGFFRHKQPFKDLSFKDTRSIAITSPVKIIAAKNIADGSWSTLQPTKSPISSTEPLEHIHKLFSELNVLSYLEDSDIPGQETAKLAMNISNIKGKDFKLLVADTLQEMNQGADGKPAASKPDDNAPRYARLQIGSTISKAVISAKAFKELLEAVEQIKK